MHGAFSLLVPLLWCILPSIIHACQQGNVSARLIYVSGSFANEVRWELRQFGNLIASKNGQGSYDVCLGPGNATIVGWDTYGDSWDGASIEIVAMKGTTL